MRPGVGRGGSDNVESPVPSKCSERELPELTAMERSVVDRPTLRLFNKLLHAPTIRLRGVAEQENEGGSGMVVGEMFGFRGSHAAPYAGTKPEKTGTDVTE